MAVNTVVHVGEVWTEVYARIAPTPSPFRVVMMPGTSVFAVERLRGLEIDHTLTLVLYHRQSWKCRRLRVFHRGSLPIAWRTLLGLRKYVLNLTFKSPNLANFRLVSHAGHGAPGRNSGRIYTVEDQVNHKVAFLKGLVAGTWQELNETDSAEQSNSFVLMGHSIGAFFALKTWNRVSGTNVNVLDACLIMPTICELYKGYSRFNKVRPLFPLMHPSAQADTPLSPFFPQIVTLPYVRNAFATLAHYLPSSFLRSAASRIGNQGDKLGEMVATKIEYVSHS